MGNRLEMRRLPGCSLPCFEPVCHGLLGGARLSVVMGDQLGIRLSGIGKTGFQKLRHLQVVLLARTAQQRFVGCILHQCMLEDISGPRRTAALVKQFRLDQLSKTLLQGGLIDGGKPGDHLVGKFAPQHRTELGKFAHLRQAVEPRHQ